MPFKVSVLEYSSIFCDSKSTVSVSCFCCIPEYEGCLVGKHLLPTRAAGRPGGFSSHSTVRTGKWQEQLRDILLTHFGCLALP